MQAAPVDRSEESLDPSTFADYELRALYGAYFADQIAKGFDHNDPNARKFFPNEWYNRVKNTMGEIAKFLEKHPEVYRKYRP